MAKKEINVGTELLNNWKKNEKKNSEEIRKSKDFKYFREHMKILAKK